ncbi:uncharacterized protein ASPGLDRAFT_158453 [Aspergillus glaucus CBS 516.65]|uniref:Uncharacterized protein n=1 Tax=Aspergillus glaucus CBS 516.65 TaxID=1160497 RepID=A0A1L9V778_ASPGL|nr:hypothetical protein ASPGLDRAFT_158453 [Aspergillus glaucus CBS 516.65]OJJ79773.1 hypothetical protein ASPGLDRAFT_158453 [Aspergillus glaucus CBS 516.65]
MVSLRSLPPNVTMSLVNGQHRIMALLSLLEDAQSLANQEAEDSNGARIAAPTAEQYFWGVDVFAQDMMSEEVQTALAANPEGLYQANSEGFNAQIIISRFECIPVGQRHEILTQTKLSDWLQNVFGVNIQHTACILSILQHDTFRSLFLQFCLTRYGECNFAWSLATKIIQSKLDCYPLRLLFFPTRDDYFNGSSIRWAPWRIDDTPLPALSQPFQTKQYEFHSRRPNFLLAFGDESYCTIYQKLREYRNLPCPTWHNWYVFERDVIVKMRKVLVHIACWVKPDWVYPAPASQRYKEFLWETELETLLFPDVVENRNAQAQEFIERLKEQIQNDQIWQDSSNESLLAAPPASLKRKPDEPGLSDEYFHRFGHLHWGRVVSLVVEMCGPILTNQMAKYNDLAYLESLHSPCLPWGLLISQSNLEKNQLLLKTRSILKDKTTKSGLIEEAELFGALWHYRVLKGHMMNTVLWGFAGGRGRPDGLLTSDTEWDNAVMVLRDCASVLIKHNFEVDLDDQQEDLSKFSLNKHLLPKSSTPHI